MVAGSPPITPQGIRPAGVRGTVNDAAERSDGGINDVPGTLGERACMSERRVEKQQGPLTIIFAALRVSSIQRDVVPILSTAFAHGGAVKSRSTSVF